MRSAEVTPPAHDMARFGSRACPGPGTRSRRGSYTLYVTLASLAWSCSPTEPVDHPGDSAPAGGDSAPGLVTSLEDLYSVSGTSADDVWAVGWRGTVIHWDGTGWYDVGEDQLGDLLLVWAASPSDVWVVERTGSDVSEMRRLLRGLPGAWAEVDYGGDDYELVGAVWGTGSSDVWVASHSIQFSEPVGRIHHYDGDSWTEVSSSAGGELAGIWGPGGGEVFVGGENESATAGYVGHVTGGQFVQNTELGGRVFSVWGFDANDVWAVGYGIDHRAGTTWSSFAPPTTISSLHGTWGSASDDVWAVGVSFARPESGYGIILHWDGAAWSEDPMVPERELFSVWGSAASDVWAVAINAIYHFDTEWTRWELAGE